MTRSIATLAVGLLLACGGTETADETPSPADTGAGPVAEPPTHGGAEGALDVRLVGSVPWETELASGTHRRVAIAHDGVVDTLPGIAVEGAPVAVGDTLVYGFDWDGGIAESAFSWTPEDGVSTIDLPDDFLGFTAFGIAPDGGHVAYAGRGEEENEEIRLKAIVRTWPGLDRIHESHRVAGYPSGGKNSAVTWHTADSVEVRIRLDELETPGGLWLRVTGSPSTGEFAADTVRGR